MLCRDIVRRWFSKARDIRVKLNLSSFQELNLNTFRASLVAFYLASSKGGQLILHFDDMRENENHMNYEKDNISILSKTIAWDEGPQNQFEIEKTDNDSSISNNNNNSTSSSYYSSRKLHRYKEVAERLLAENKAYRCFCQSETLSSNVNGASLKIPFYNGTCRHLSEDKVAKNIKKGIGYSIRLKTKHDKQFFEEISFSDEIHQHLTTKKGYLQNNVIIKRDGNPTKFFMFAVDDFDLSITHVVRQIEWLTDLPKQRLIYDMLETEAPRFYHLPNMKGADGLKLSAVQMYEKFRISQLFQKGYQLEALSNFAITQIWQSKINKLNSTSSQQAEIDLASENKNINTNVTTQDNLTSTLKTSFVPHQGTSLNRGLSAQDYSKIIKQREVEYISQIHTSEYIQSHFDEHDLSHEIKSFDKDKLNFFNRFYIRQKYAPLFGENPNQEQSQQLIKDFQAQLVMIIGSAYLENIAKISDKNMVQIIELITNRIRYWDDLKSYSFFFVDPKYDSSLSKQAIQAILQDKDTNRKYIQVLKDMINIFNKKIPDSQFKDTVVNKNVHFYLETVNTKIHKTAVMSVLRFALTGYHQSHTLGLTAQVIGKQAAVRRLRYALKFIENLGVDEE